MNHLDVGLLGTAPIDDPRAPVVPVAATGHVRDRAHRPPRRRRQASGTAGRSRRARSPASPPGTRTTSPTRPAASAPTAARTCRTRRRSRSAASWRCPTCSSCAGCASWVREEFVARAARTTWSGPYLDGLALDRPVRRRLLAARDPRPARARGHRRRPAYRARQPAAAPRGRRPVPAPRHRRCWPADSGSSSQFVAVNDARHRLGTAPVDNVRARPRAEHVRRDPQTATPRSARCPATSTVSSTEFDAQANEVARDSAAGAGGPLIEGLNASQERTPMRFVFAVRGRAHPRSSRRPPAASRRSPTRPTSRSSWLGRLRMLIGVPFEYVVPDDGLLRPETIRFFYIDRNWTDAAVDGAIAAGVYGTRDRLTLQQRHAAGARRRRRRRAPPARRRRGGRPARAAATLAGFAPSVAGGVGLAGAARARLARRAPAGDHAHGAPRSGRAAGASSTTSPTGWRSRSRGRASSSVSGPHRHRRAGGCVVARRPRPGDRSRGARRIPQERVPFRGGSGGRHPPHRVCAASSTAKHAAVVGPTLTRRRWRCSSCATRTGSGSASVVRRLHRRARHATSPSRSLAGWLKVKR